MPEIVLIDVFFAKWHEHDFTMFKDSRLPLMVETIVIVDKGYQGIIKIHENSMIPFKASKKHKLTPEQKKHNSVIGKKRIVIEHVNRYLKRFRLLSSRYRNKQKRFSLRFSFNSWNLQFSTSLLGFRIGLLLRNYDNNCENCSK